jgi:hypothetical protein
MQNSARCVLPVTSINTFLKRRSTSQGGVGAPSGHLRKRDLQLVERIVARFVHARVLARGPDKQSREQV